MCGKRERQDGGAGQRNAGSANIGSAAGDKQRLGEFRAGRMGLLTRNRVFMLRNV
jgi:hypothetical protein